MEPGLETWKHHASGGSGCDVETMFPHLILPHRAAPFLLSGSEVYRVDRWVRHGCGGRCLSLVFFFFFSLTWATGWESRGCLLSPRGLGFFFLFAIHSHPPSLPSSPFLPCFSPTACLAYFWGNKNYGCRARSDNHARTFYRLSLWKLGDKHAQSSLNFPSEMVILPKDEWSSRLKAHWDPHLRNSTRPPSFAPNSAAPLGLMERLCTSVRSRLGRNLSPDCDFEFEWVFSLR